MKSNFAKKFVFSLDVLIIYECYVMKLPTYFILEILHSFLQSPFDFLLEGKIHKPIEESFAYARLLGRARRGNPGQIQGEEVLP